MLNGAAPLDVSPNVDSIGAEANQADRLRWALA